MGTLTTLEHSSPPLPDVIPGGIVAPEFKTMVDEDLMLCIDSLAEQRRLVADYFKAIEAEGKAEIQRRIEERGATAIPSKDFECKLEDEWSAYAYDTSLLEKARTMLPDDEAVKVCKFVPERTEIIPARTEPGNARSITALREKYAGSPVAEVLSQAMTRSHLGKKVVIKRIAKGVNA